MAATLCLCICFIFTTLPWPEGLETFLIQLRLRDHWGDDRLVGLESVLLGERNLAQQALEIVLFGYSSPQRLKALCAARWTS